MIRSGSDRRAGRKRTLLIGCSTGDLVVESTVELFARCLIRRGFAAADIQRIEGAGATANVISSSLEAFVAEAEPDDVAVLAYFGHALLLDDVDYELPGARERAKSGFIQFLLPVDHARSTAQRPRVVSRVELSGFVRRLSSVTRNVTVLLDCCHAAEMIGPEPGRSQSDAREWHAERSAQAGAYLASTARRRSARAHHTPVRLVASTAMTKSYQSVGERPYCLFTKHLVDLLDETREQDVSWDDLVFAAQQRISETRPLQSVGVEGARARVPFTTRARPLGDREYPCHVGRGGRVVVGAGRLHGVRVGETFTIFNPPSRGGASPRALARAVVESTTPEQSELRVVRDLSSGRLGVGARALRGRPARRYGVELTVTDVVDARALAEQLGILGCYAVSAGRACPSTLARIEASSTRAIVKDWAGETVFESRVETSRGSKALVTANCPRPLTDALMDGVLEALSKLVSWRERYEHTTLVPCSGERGAPVVQWGVFDERGVPTELVERASVREGARIWIRIQCSDAWRHPEFYCSAFRVTADREVRQLSADAAFGRALRRGEACDIGGIDDRDALVEWPVCVSRDGVHTESLLIYISPDPLSLHALATGRRQHGHDTRSGLRSEGPPWVISMSYRIVPKTRDRARQHRCANENR